MIRPTIEFSNPVWFPGGRSHRGSYGQQKMIDKPAKLQAISLHTGLLFQNKYRIVTWPIRLFCYFSFFLSLNKIKYFFPSWNSHLFLIWNFFIATWKGSNALPHAAECPNIARLSALSQGESIFFFFFLKVLHFIRVDSVAGNLWSSWFLRAISLEHVFFSLCC